MMPMHCHIDAMNMIDIGFFLGHGEPEYLYNVHTQSNSWAITITKKQVEGTESDIMWRTLLLLLVRA